MVKKIIVVSLILIPQLSAMDAGGADHSANAGAFKRERDLRRSNNRALNQEQLSEIKSLSEVMKYWEKLTAEEISGVEIRLNALPQDDESVQALRKDVEGAKSAQSRKEYIARKLRDNERKLLETKRREAEERAARIEQNKAIEVRASQKAHQEGAKLELERKKQRDAEQFAKKTQDAERLELLRFQLKNRTNRTTRSSDLEEKGEKGKEERSETIEVLEERTAKMERRLQEQRAQEQEQAKVSERKHKLAVRQAMLDKCNALAADNLRLHFELEDEVAAGNSRAKWLYDNQGNIVVEAAEFLDQTLDSALFFATNNAIRNFSDASALAAPLQERWNLLYLQLNELISCRFAAGMHPAIKVLLEKMDAIKANTWKAYLLGLCPKPSEKEFWILFGAKSDSDLIKGLERKAEDLARAHDKRIKTERDDDFKPARKRNPLWWLGLVTVGAVAGYSLQKWYKNQKKVA